MVDFVCLERGSVAVTESGRQVQCRKMEDSLRCALKGTGMASDTSGPESPLKESRELRGWEGTACARSTWWAMAGL